MFQTVWRQEFWKATYQATPLCVVLTSWINCERSRRRCSYFFIRENIRINWRWYVLSLFIFSLENFGPAIRFSFLLYSFLIDFCVLALDITHKNSAQQSVFTLYSILVNFCVLTVGITHEFTPSIVRHDFEWFVDTDQIHESPRSSLVDYLVCVTSGLKNSWLTSIRLG